MCRYTWFLCDIMDKSVSQYFSGDPGFMCKKITVVGAGHVGLVTAACLAHIGHEVLCHDIDHEKTEALGKGRVSICEAGLADMVAACLKSGRLAFTSDYPAVVSHGEIIIIAVDTPPGGDGSADVSRVFFVADRIAEAMRDDRIIVIKSTTPAGTCRRVSGHIAKRLQASGRKIDFSVACVPEFLREGSAVADFLRPDRIVFGVLDDRAAKALHETYRRILESGAACLDTDPESAELIKYASNAFLAAKLAFVNEVSALCEHTGANIRDVACGLGLDSRIGRSFLNPGPGFGGSCFPKDVMSLVHTAKRYGCGLPLIFAAIESNRLQKARVIDKITRLCKGLAGKTFAALGTAYKAGTDDIRESPAVDIIEQMIAGGAAVRAYDPAAMDKTRAYLGPAVYCARDEYDAAQGADAIVILTEWEQFSKLDFSRLAGAVRRRVVMDFRSVACAGDAVRAGFEYYGIGMPEG